MSGMNDKKKERTMSLALLFVGAIWGFGFIAVEFALESGFTTLFINFFRFAVASVLTFAAFPKTILKMKWKDVKVSLLSGLFMAFGFFFQVLGQTYTTPGNNALITGSYTVFVPMLLALFFKVRPHKNEVVAAIVAFVGIIVLYLPNISLKSFHIGDIYSVIAAICFALQFINLDKAVKNADPKIVTFVQLLLSTVLFLVFFLIVDVEKVPSFDFSKGVLPVLYLGVFSSFTAYVIQTHAQKILSPTKVSVIMASEAVFGAILSIAFGYENVTVTFVVGGIMAISGLLISQIRPKAKTSAQSATVTENGEENASSGREKKD